MRDYFMRTERLGFSVWTEDDLDLALLLWGNHAVTRFIVSGGKMDRNDIRSRLEKEIECQSRHGFQYWPIFLHETDEFVGCCGLRPYGDEPKVLEMGVHLLEGHWKKGIATEACIAVIGRAFDDLGVDWLFAGHSPENIGSAKLLAKLGFRFLKCEYYPPTGSMHPSYRLDRIVGQY
jgi:[ribosomal protein S5]-alanine N-acetyltransferase